MLDAVQVHSTIINKMRVRVSELETRMSYLESRTSAPDKIMLTKLFSDNKNIIKLRKK